MLMVVGYVLLVVVMFGVLYVGLLLVGMGYGVYWVIVFVIVLELFGLKYFGIIFNFLIMVNLVGLFVFFGLIVGILYDCEVKK